VADEELDGVLRGFRQGRDRLGRDRDFPEVEACPLQLPPQHEDRSALTEESLVSACRTE
jgi:hypothetical protein